MNQSVLAKESIRILGRNLSSMAKQMNTREGGVVVLFVGWDGQAIAIDRVARINSL